MSIHLHIIWLELGRKSFKLYHISIVTVYNHITYDQSKLLKQSLKGALDKYNIYLFISNSKEDFELNQYRNFQLILPMRFHFMRYFVNSIISWVSHRLLYCVFIEVDFEK